MRRIAVLGVDPAARSGAALLIGTAAAPELVWTRSVDVGTRDVEICIRDAFEVAEGLDLPLYLAIETWTGGSNIRLNALLAMAGARDVWRRTFRLMAREDGTSRGVTRATKKLPVSWAPTRVMLAKLQSWRAEVLPRNTATGGGMTKRGRPRIRTRTTEDWKAAACAHVATLFSATGISDDEAEAACIALWGMMQVHSDDAQTA